MVFTDSLAPSMMLLGVRHSNSIVKVAAINTGEGPHPGGPVYSCEN